MSRTKHYEKVALEVASEARYKLDLIEVGKEVDGPVQRRVPTGLILRKWTFYNDSDLGHDKVKLTQVRLNLDAASEIASRITEVVGRGGPEIEIRNELSAA
jgi:hypothetical protein